MRVAITGGTGTLGQALTAGYLRDSTVERIVIVSRDEVKQAMMALEYSFDPRLRFFLGDIRDEPRLEDAFYGCDTVIHAAALKRVDAVAYNPSEVRKTNVEGSANVVRAAMHCHVRKVLMVSSDKACHPTNVYGASKAMMEHEAVAGNATTYPRGTAVACVRYGNVLGSRGSVLSLWRQAVKEGRPLPLTHKDMTRFWLTVEDAAAFVRWAVWATAGGEIFVPKMEAMAMTDFAEALAPGHPIVETGLRPGGEKLHEIVITEDEASRTLFNYGYYVIRPWLHPWTETYAWHVANYIGPVGGALRSNEVQRISVDAMRTMLAADL